MSIQEYISVSVYLTHMVNVSYFNLAMDCLKRLAILANGNINRYYDVAIFTKEFSNRISANEFQKEILEILLQNKWITKKDNSIAITYEGISKVSSQFDIAPTSLGILSTDDVRRITPIIVNFLISEKDHSNTIELHRIEDNFKALSEKAILQIINNLESRGIVKQLENQIKLI